MTTSDARIMALTMYNVDCIKTFKVWKYNEIKEIVKEVSELSQRGPIHETNFDKGYWKGFTKNMNLKYLECNADNEFTIKGIDKKYSPLFLMAVMEYGINRLSGNQIEDMEGFGHLKNARILSKPRKKVKRREETITRIINMEIDNLEDILNSKIRVLLEETLSDVTSDDMVKAREIFFRG